MKEILNTLYEHKTLSRIQAKEVLINIASQQYNSVQVSAFLSVFLMRLISVDELSGFRDAMLELCKRVDFNTNETIDIVGTGGDGKDTFNISTLACFITAGAGVKVTKHGNYGVSSISGSSNVLEAIGYKFTNDKSILQKQLDEAGICFLHAPLFHPAMKNVAMYGTGINLRYIKKVNENPNSTFFFFLCLFYYFYLSFYVARLKTNAGYHLFLLVAVYI